MLVVFQEDGRSGKKDDFYEKSILTFARLLWKIKYKDNDFCENSVNNKW